MQSLACTRIFRNKCNCSRGFFFGKACEDWNRRLVSMKISGPIFTIFLASFWFYVVILNGSSCYVEAVETGCVCPNLYRCENSLNSSSRNIHYVQDKSLKHVVLRNDASQTSNYTSDPEVCKLRGQIPVVVGWNFTFSCTSLLDRCLYCNMFTRQNETTPIYPGGTGVCGVSIWRTALFAVGMVACTFILAVGLFFSVRCIQPRVNRWRRIRKIVQNEHKHKPKVPMAYMEYGQELNDFIYLCFPEVGKRSTMQRDTTHDNCKDIFCCPPYFKILLNGGDCCLKQLSTRLIGHPNGSSSCLISVQVDEGITSRDTERIS